MKISREIIPEQSGVPSVLDCSNPPQASPLYQLLSLLQGYLETSLGQIVCFKVRQWQTYQSEMQVSSRLLPRKPVPVILAGGLAFITMGGCSDIYISVHFGETLGGLGIAQV
jgi:hypothetical protein